MNADVLQNKNPSQSSEHGAPLWYMNNPNFLFANLPFDMKVMPMIAFMFRDDENLIVANIKSYLSFHFHILKAYFLMDNPNSILFC